MLRSMMKASCMTACLLVATFALAQREFSADMVNTGRQGTPVQAKIYFAKDKMRIEPVQHAGMGGAVIMDLAAHTSIVLMDQQHMYMEMPAHMANQHNDYVFFYSIDVENACPQWLAQPRNKGGTCRKVGNDTVNGRPAVKYEGTNASGESMSVWLDPKIDFPVKWEGKDGSGELRNIQEGSQPASLFEVPAGYRKFDLPSMMQHKQ